MSALLFLQAILLLSPVSTTSGSYIEDLKKCRAFYEESQSVSFSATATTFKSAADTKGKTLGTGKMKKMGKYYYSSFVNDEVMITNDEIVILNHQERSILYSEFGSSDGYTPPFTIDFEKIAKRDSVSYKGIKGNYKCYELYTPGKEIIRTEVYLDATLGYLAKIVYYYNVSDQSFDFGGYKTEVVYTDVERNSVDKSFFSTKKFIQKNGGKISPSENYKQYKVTISKKS